MGHGVKKIDDGKESAGVNSSSKFIFSTADACDFFGISREALSSWAKKGAPKEARGKWDLKKLLEWRYKGQHMESPETRKIKAEADLKEAKAAQEQIKLGTIKTKYIPADEVKTELSRLFLALKKSLLAMSHAVASDLSALDQEAAETAKSVVDNRVADALKTLSEGGSYIAKGKRKQK